MNVAEGRRGPHEIGLLLAGAMCALPFLVPYHQLPVLSFYPEWLAAALGVCAALMAIAWPRGAHATRPAPAAWLIAFALFLLLRTVAFEQSYFQASLLGALYIIFAALMMWLGVQIASALGLERVAVTLAAFLLAGAIANALAGVIQYYGRPALLEDLVAELNSDRAHGNIAQANLYANYLALGQCALLFLWLRRRLRAAYALPIAVLLAVGSALSGSRGAVIFAGWIAVFGGLATPSNSNLEMRRLRWAACLMAGLVLISHLGVPWLNESLHVIRANENPIGRLGALSAQADPRWQIYRVAWRVFSTAPLLGVGMGEFPGASFVQGLEPSLTRIGEVWTSPHDLPLHLLAETGIVGFGLVLVALGVWIRDVAGRYASTRHAALWWIIAGTGVELIHSLFEFPLWSADFLGVTALLMGVGVAPGSSRSAPAVGRIGAAGSCAVLVLALAMLLRDYVRLDATRITGSVVTLASVPDAQRDAAVLKDVARGLLAPVAELWIVLGAPLDRNDLALKIVLSERVASFWPSEPVLVRRSVFLALDGQSENARALLWRVLQTFPEKIPAAIATLEIASAVDADAVRPLLLIARDAAE